MSEEKSKLLRRANPLNSWFVPLDKDKRALLKSGRFRVLLLSFSILALLSVTLLNLVIPTNPLATGLQDLTVWIVCLAIVLLLILVWVTWRELLQPLISLCNWADQMRAINLDAQVKFKQDSDFSELAVDINMLGNMINNLSRDTEVQLQKHTDYISLE
jgi:nitrate/nitrite-specific signal transduction histidine kinase